MWLITEVDDKSQKRQLLITKKCQEIPKSINPWLIAKKVVFAGLSLKERYKDIIIK